jgi:hypothetical protein
MDCVVCPFTMNFILVFEEYPPHERLKDDKGYPIPLEHSCRAKQECKKFSLFFKVLG